jgi:pyruvate formate lyase activating enzyme
MTKTMLQCDICAHGCQLQEGGFGICGVRQCKGGRIESLVYGRIIAEHVDPIEKKPLYHVLPGSLSYSIATPGCNFHCRHCQNYNISQVARGFDVSRAGVYRAPQDIVTAAVDTGCRSISYTYVEPTVFYEYALDCCQLGHEAGLANIFVSNGFMSEKTVKALAQVLTAINIDLKSFSDDFYRRICGGRLQPVLDNIALFQRLGVWVEVTTLLIPGYNDSQGELEGIAAFLFQLNPDIPWHVTGFYPTYKLTDAPPTSSRSLMQARDIGFRQGLHYVYTGNRPGSPGDNSFCPDCGREIISRQGFRVTANHLHRGTCPGCGTMIPGLWS